MNTKVNKLLKLAAAGLFLVALAINVKVTLDDPFVMLSEQAIATGSNTVSVSGTTAITKDERKDIKTFNDGDQLTFTTSISNSDDYSYSVGINVSVPQTGGVVGANGNTTYSSTTGSGSTSMEVHTVSGNNKQYHRWVCVAALGICSNNGAGSSWRMISDPLPPTNSGNN